MLKPRYEYAILEKFDSGYVFFSGPNTDLSLKNSKILLDLLNEIGKDGWCIVATDPKNNFYILMRSVLTPLSQEEIEQAQSEAKTRHEQEIQNRFM